MSTRLDLKHYCLDLNFSISAHNVIKKKIWRKEKIVEGF